MATIARARCSSCGGFIIASHGPSPKDPGIMVFGTWRHTPPLVGVPHHEAKYDWRTPILDEFQPINSIHGVKSTGERMKRVRAENPLPPKRDKPDAVGLWKEAGKQMKKEKKRKQNKKGRGKSYLVGSSDGDTQTWTANIEVTPQPLEPDYRTAYIMLANLVQEVRDARAQEVKRSIKHKQTLIRNALPGYHDWAAFNHKFDGDYRILSPTIRKLIHDARNIDLLVKGDTNA